MLPDVVAKNGFSLDRIATLCSVVDCGSIAAAAGSSQSRQSQFSRQIKELEEAIGSKLFVRVGKTLQPTALGSQLSKISRLYLESVRDLAQRETDRPGLVLIGGGEAMLRWLLIPSIPAVRAMLPPVHFRLKSLRTTEVIQELEFGRIDAGLVRQTGVPDGFITEPVGSFEFSFVVPRKMLRTRSADEVYHGQPLPFAELMGDGQLATTARSIAKDAGIQLNRVTQAETLSLLVELVEHEDAAAFVPSVAAKKMPQNRFAIIRMPGIQLLNRETVLAWLPKSCEQKPYLIQSLRALCRILRQSMRDEQDRLRVSDHPPHT